MENDKAERLKAALLALPSPIQHDKVTQHGKPYLSLNGLFVAVRQPFLDRGITVFQDEVDFELYQDKSKNDMARARYAFCFMFDGEAPGPDVRLEHLTQIAQVAGATGEKQLRETALNRWLKTKCQLSSSGLVADKPQGTGKRESTPGPTEKVRPASEETGKQPEGDTSLGRFTIEAQGGFVQKGRFNNDRERSEVFFRYLMGNVFVEDPNRTEEDLKKLEELAHRNMGMMKALIPEKGLASLTELWGELGFEKIAL